MEDENDEVIEGRMGEDETDVAAEEFEVEMNEIRFLRAERKSY